MRVRLYFVVWNDDGSKEYSLDYRAPLKQGADWKELRDKLFRTYMEYLEPPKTKRKKEVA